MKARTVPRRSPLGQLRFVTGATIALGGAGLLLADLARLAA